MSGLWLWSGVLVCANTFYAGLLWDEHRKLSRLHLAVAAFVVAAMAYGSFKWI